MSSPNRPALLPGLFALWLIVGALPLQLSAQTAPAVQLIEQLGSEFGLNERQVRGALGALLVFVRERLPKKDFDDLAKRIPNAERAMQEVKLQGIVTKPLDNIGDYEESLSSLGIGQPLASQIAPAVVKHLGQNGYYRERDILARALD